MDYNNEETQRKLYTKVFPALYRMTSTEFETIVYGEMIDMEDIAEIRKQGKKIKALTSAYIDGLTELYCKYAINAFLKKSAAELIKAKFSRRRKKNGESFFEHICGDFATLKRRQEKMRRTDMKVPWVIRNCKPGEEQIHISIKCDEKQKANFKQMRRALKNLNRRREHCGDSKAKYVIQRLPDEKESIEYLKKRNNAWAEIQNREADIPEASNSDFN